MEIGVQSVCGGMLLGLTPGGEVKEVRLDQKSLTVRQSQQKPETIL